jgi:hypothetical protein
MTKIEQNGVVQSSQLEKLFFADFWATIMKSVGIAETI